MPCLVLLHSGANRTKDTKKGISGFLLAVIKVPLGALGERAISDQPSALSVQLRLGGRQESGLEFSSLLDCGAADATHDGQITDDEILTAVNNALNGCVQSP